MALEATRSAPTDLRREPRAYGTLHLAWHRGTDADVAAWLGGGPAVAPERTPDPTMNFSAAGIAFDDVDACVDGELLLIELGIPGEPERWRGAARVVRVSPIPIDERDEHVAATHRIAVNVTALSDEGDAALRAYTARVRQANGRAGEGAR